MPFGGIRCCCVNSGDGGSRTRVQTRNEYAFYMFISASIFEQEQDRSYQLLPYPLNTSAGLRGQTNLSLIFPHLHFKPPQRRGTWEMSRFRPLGRN